MIDVLICGDSLAMRTRISRMLAPEEDLRVVGETATSQDCVSKMYALRPHVLLIDMAMPLMDALSCIQEARRRRMPAIILVISATSVAETSETLEALSAGATAALARPRSESEASRTELANFVRGNYGRPARPRSSLAEATGP